MSCLQPSKVPIAKITEVKKPQDSADITSLTAEIESFVRIADTDKEMLESKTKEFRVENENDIDDTGEVSLRRSPEHNDCYSQDCHTEEITIERIQNLGEIDENSNQRCKKSPVKILIRAPTDEEPFQNFDKELILSIEQGNIDSAHQKAIIIDSVQTGMETIEENKQNKEENPEITVEANVDCNEELTTRIEHENIDSTHQTNMEMQTNMGINEENKQNKEDPEIRVETHVDCNEELKTSSDDGSLQKPVIIDSVQTSMETNERNKENVGNKDEVPAVKAEKHIDCNEELKVQDQNETTAESLAEKYEKYANKSNSYSEVNELKITESSDDLSQIGLLNDGSKQYEAIIENFDSTKYLSSSSTRVCSIPLRVKEGTSFIGNYGKKEPPTPPQRRRSVREIIESINKCQSLLKVNQDLKNSKVNNTDLFQTSSLSSSSSPPVPPPTKAFKNKSFFIDRNMNDTNKKEYQNKRLFTDMTEVNNNAKVEEMCNIPLFVEKFSELNNNNDSNDLFEQIDQKESNVESRWNPVPKPRRHRNSTNNL